MALKIYNKNTLIILEDGVRKDQWFQGQVKFVVNSGTIQFFCTTRDNIATYTESVTDLEDDSGVIGTESQVIDYLATFLDELPVSKFQDYGANVTLNVKATKGEILSLSCENTNLFSTRYIQIHDTATVPGAGAVPTFSFLVPASSQIVIGSDFFTDNGVTLDNGIAFAFSTTSNTYTAATAGNQSTQINYR